MAKSKNTFQLITDGYLESLFKQKKRPTNVYLFTKQIGIAEKDFYEHFSSIDGIELHFWNHYLQNTIEKLKADKVYEEYSAREKLLAFYYTFLELAVENRSFFQFSIKENSFLSPFSTFPDSVKKDFDEYVKDIINQGVANGEIEARQLLTDKYYWGFWLQFIFVLDFWSKDKSQKFEKTDAAIEKAVNLSFDLLAKNPLDGLFDFGKFVIQNKAGI